MKALLQFLQWMHENQAGIAWALVFLAAMLLDHVVQFRRGWSARGRASASRVVKEMPLK